MEGLGMRDNDPGEAPRRYARWLDELAKPAAFRDYASFDELASRLLQKNPRLTRERADFLAHHWGKLGASGRVALRSDPAHRRVNPVLYRMGEIAACMRNITAPVLWLQGELSDSPGRLGLAGEELTQRKRLIGNLRQATLAGAGHMLHHDQPERVADAVVEFLAP
jgi:pimeloyl-ACP methyl ester carboxylesterase